MRVLEALDAQAVRRWYQWGLVALDATRDEINSLNVFPVPDADTGTNLHLTLESAVEPTPLETLDLAGTATEMARLSLLGARGSSGVILSQLLRGVAEVLAGERLPPRGLGLTRALERASTLAYAAVSRPVEGTMLTVARAASQAARATGSDDLHVVVDAAAEAARSALAETPSQLDVLGRAGVVDAGGRGVVVLLDVLQAVVEERPLPTPKRTIAHPRLEAVDLDSSSAQAYEVMYLLDADDERIAGLRHDLDRIGDSVVVSGGGGLWNVHVHTDDAGAAVECGSAVGHPHRVRITAITETHGTASHAVDDETAHDETAHDETAHDLVVLLAAGSPLFALRDVLIGAGALVVAITESLAEATVIANSRVRVVALLAEPASDRALHAAENLLVRQGIRVATVSTRSPVQLLAAVAVHDPHRSLVDDVAAMTAASAATRYGEVLRRDGGSVGVVEGIEPVVGDESAAVALAVLGHLLTDDAELVTVVASTELTARIAQQVRDENPAIEVAVVVADLGPNVWLGVE